MKILRGLIYLILVLTITGLIPALAVALVIKYDLLAILVGILVIVSIFYEISKM